jgi:hypothetical protein
MQDVTSDEDCDEMPFEGLVSLESTTPSNRPNLKKQANIKSKVLNLTFKKLKRMGFSASISIHDLVVDGCVLPVVVFTVNLHHFLCILLL